MRAHSALIAGEEWIIDGYGGKTVWERLDAADTLIHVDLPLAAHAIGDEEAREQVCFTPQGWPEGSPLIASSLSSYRVLWPCNRHLTPKSPVPYMSGAAEKKRIVHLRSRRQIKEFLEAMNREVSLARSNAA